MTKSKHTAGRYYVAEMNRKGMFTNDGAATILAENGDEVTPIATVLCQSRYPRGRGHNAACAERDANANLFAAAADMLAELKEVLRCAALPEPWAKPIRAVIAKAENGSE